MTTDNSSGLFGGKEEGLFGRDPEPPMVAAAAPAAPTTPAAATPTAAGPGRAAMLRAVAALVLVALVGWTLTQAIDDDSPESAARQSIADLQGYADVQVDLDGDVLTVSGQVPDESGRQAVLAAVAGIDGIAEVDDDLELTRFAAGPGPERRAGLEADLDLNRPSEPAVLTAASSTTVAPTTSAAPPTTARATATTAAPTTTLPTTTITATTMVTTTTFGIAEAQIAASNAVDQLGVTGVRVVVDGDPPTATVSGEVASETERDAVLAALSTLEGIDRLDDQLVVTHTSAGDDDGSTDPDSDGSSGDGDPAVDDGDSSAAEDPGDSADADGSGDDSTDADSDGSSGDDDPAVDDGDGSVAEDPGDSANDDDTGSAGQPDSVDGVVDSIASEHPVRFGLGSAGLEAGAQAALAELADALIADPTAMVEIAGHTCDLGPSDKNQVLSEARAAAVADHLLASGVGADQILTVGFGETMPAFDNRDPLEAPKNRRVDITVLR